MSLPMCIIKKGGTVCYKSKTEVPPSTLDTDKHKQSTPWGHEPFRSAYSRIYKKLAVFSFENNYLKFNFLKCLNFIYLLYPYYLFFLYLFFIVLINIYFSCTRILHLYAKVWKMHLKQKRKRTIICPKLQIYMHLIMYVHKNRSYCYFFDILI